jgi:flagellar hook-associated protein 3 FlgL
LPKVVVNLQMQQTSYQAALAATARVMQPTLLDFLR